MKRLSILLLLVLFIFPKSYAANDSLKQVVFGVEINYNSSYVPKRISSRFAVKPSAKSWGVLGFAEFQVLRRVRLATGIGLTSLSFSNLNNIHNDLYDNPRPVDNTQTFTFYRVSSKELMISSTFTCRFDYVENPKIYFILGVQPRFNLTSKESNVYSSTEIHRELNTEDSFIENVVLSDPTPAPVYRKGNFTLAGEMGIGTEIRNIALEVSFRKISSDSFLLNFWGGRLRYKI